VERPVVAPACLVRQVPVQRDPRRASGVVPVGGEVLGRLPDPELVASRDTQRGAGKRLPCGHCTAAERRAVSALRGLCQALEALPMRVVGEVDVGKNVVFLVLGVVHRFSPLANGRGGSVPHGSLRPSPRVRRLPHVAVEIIVSVGELKLGPRAR